MFVRTYNEIINVDDIQSVQIIKQPDIESNAFYLYITYKSNHNTTLIGNRVSSISSGFSSEAEARRRLTDLYTSIKQAKDLKETMLNNEPASPRSTVTFNDVAGDMNFVKVIWNEKVVFEDDERTTAGDVKDFEEKYGNKIVYEINARIVDFHNYEFDVKGEEVE